MQHRFISTALCLALGHAAHALEMPKNVPSSARPLDSPHPIERLNIHDPAILADPDSRKYYVYDSYHAGDDYEKLATKSGRTGVEAYWSEDLQTWHGPQLVYEVEEDSWAQTDMAPWAPEVAFYQGRYYLFATPHNTTEPNQVDAKRPPLVKRGTQIFVSDSPLGPFTRLSNSVQTPENEMALDGTLWIEDGEPWMVYCQEWIETGEGLIKAIKMQDDLSAPVGSPLTMINAGDVDWTAKTTRYNGENITAVVTDGPWLYRSKTGVLMLLWSSWNIDKEKRYTTSLAFSESGSLGGPWVHRDTPIISGDVGHGNIFRSFDGELLLAVHRYFKQPHTRLQIYALEDLGDDLKVGELKYGHP